MTRPGMHDLGCPCCGHKFTTHVLYSTNTFGGTTTDLRPIAVGEQPTRYHVHCCPACGFAGTEDDFEGQVSPEVAAHVAERITPLVREQRPSSARQFEFAAWIAEWQGQAPEQVGDCYLQAAWMTDEESPDDAPAAIDHRRQAVAWYLKAVDPRLPVPKESLTLAYLIGELHRRIGDTSSAGSWFARVIDTAADDPDLAQLASLARQQRDDPQELVPTS